MLASMQSHSCPPSRRGRRCADWRWVARARQPRQRLPASDKRGRSTSDGPAHESGDGPLARHPGAQRRLRGVTLAVMVLGLAVVFGLLGVINIAHGEFIMVGAYCAYVRQAHGWPYLAAVPARADGLRRARARGRALPDPPALCAAVRHAGRDLGPEPAPAQARRSVFGLGYKSLKMPLAGTVAVLGTVIRPIA